MKAVIANALRGWLRGFVSWACLLAGLLVPAHAADHLAVDLPAGVSAVWGLDKAYREITPTRERVSLNGLWRWQPGAGQQEEVPVREWGYFKVPGCWPGIGDYMQKDCQTMFAHPSWLHRRLDSLATAWYQREFTVPANWSGRKITARMEYLNSFATVFVDGKRAGEVRFPGGEIDLTAFCQLGRTHVLSLLVVALPIKGVLVSYTDSASAREVKGSVARRGLCGDVSLIGAPMGPRLGESRVVTSVRKKEFTFGAAVENLQAGARYALRARVLNHGRVLKEFTSRAFRISDLKAGRIEFTQKWLPERLWDVHTPDNGLDLELTLQDGDGRVLDAGWNTHFGPREFWIEGRDFYLNGKRIYLSSVPLNNAQISAFAASYAGAKESLQRLKDIGINYVYTHNYSCEPGTHLAFEEILRAADDVGMLVGLSQPHFSHYEWPAGEAEAQNGYAGHAAYFAGVAGNHPSVVMYAMSHNATGYSEDMNPDLIDGLHEPRESWSMKNVKLALRAEAIVKAIDPSRVIYHHASGNLGSMHAVNFYPNFVPIQELSDWFEHWSTHGVKPVFTCEYGAPFTWDWTMYRGWYQGQREFGSAVVPWEFCLAEWNAQFFGDSAYQISEPEKANLRWEAGQFRAGKGWHRWDYPNQVGSTIFDERYPLFAWYLTDNWRAFRTLGVSAISPWEHGHFWKLRDGVDKRRRELKVDWEQLQRPGYSADYVDQQYERMDLAYERSDWIATPAAQALIRNNLPLLAYIGGQADQVTGKDHNFTEGETVEKQVVIINNSRETVTCEAKWTLRLPGAIQGARKIAIGAGQQARIPVKLELPASLSAGAYELRATCAFSNGETQTDQFSIDVIARPEPANVFASVAIFDPKGHTTALLNRLGIFGTAVVAGTDLSKFKVLVVGKGALTTNGAAPDILRVRDGLKVVVFEQTAEVMEKRLGFRVAEYGLRQVFPRVPDHPITAGVTPEALQDWRGFATLTSPRLNYEMRPKYGVTVQWAGLPQTRLWRCGNRGNVASVLLEKPARGDFMPILDGGYALQYSPLLEYHEGRGMVLFCQLDVSGRTENDPAADRLTRNLLQYANDWQPGARLTVAYAGEASGKRHLENLGLSVVPYAGGNLTADQVLVVGPGAGKSVSNWSAVAPWLKAGGHLLGVGLEQADLDAVLPGKVVTKKGEHIATYFAPRKSGSPLAGISPGDMHNRDPRNVALVTSGAVVLGDGVVAQPEAGVVLCQLSPWAFEGAPMNLRRTHRHISFAVSRLLGNLGVGMATPVLERFGRAVDGKSTSRFMTGLYLDTPEEWDDPYRFFRW